MKTRATDSEQYFAELRKQIQEAHALGDLDRALQLCNRAVAWAAEHGSQEDRHLAQCNQGEILINLGEGERAIGELKKILLSSTDSTHRFLASYSISEYHLLKSEVDRGLFYARLALGHAKNAGGNGFEAGAEGQIAGLQLLGSYFEDAGASFQRALDLLPEQPRIDRAIYRANLGYCQVVQGEVDAGLANLFDGMRLMRELGAEAWTRFPHIGISYAYLEKGDWEKAKKHAKAALELSEASGTPAQIKNSIYLLGEAEKLGGDEIAACDLFLRLQEEFYPDEPHITDFLMATDIKKLINLMV
ncbi:MAG: hypothetical protein GY719_07390 [bacterium]|nr:hypothetical protein [bacterium]